MEIVSEQTMKNYMQKAEEDLKDGNILQTLQWYGMAANVYLPEPGTTYLFGNIQIKDDYGAQREIRETAINKLSQAALDLKKQGKYHKALQIYRYAPSTFEKQINELDRLLPFEDQIKQAKQLAHQKKFLEAYEILDNAELKTIPDIIKLKLSIRKEQAEWEKEQEKNKAPEEKAWVFLKKTDLPPKNTLNWKIENNRLELNINGEDTITGDTFDNLMKETLEKHISYILIGIVKNGFYHFIDGSYLPQLVKTWQNPFTRETPSAVDIFVAGDDGKLTFLGQMEKKEVYSNFVNWNWPSYYLKKGLDRETNFPGLSYLLIAQLFKKKAKPIIDITKIRQLENKITSLTNQALKESTGDAETWEFFNQINQLRDQINNLKKGTVNPEAEIDLQYARQWFDWASQYLPEGLERVKAEFERDEIPYKPEILPNDIQPLIKNLQNLTYKLRQLSAKLVT